MVSLFFDDVFGCWMAHLKYFGESFFDELFCRFDVTIALIFGGTGFSDFYEYFFGSGEQANTRIVKRSDVEDEARGPRGSPTYR